MKWALFMFNIIFILILFSLGYVLATKNQSIEQPIEFSNKELPSPSDWIKEDQIQVLNDKIIINIANPKWAKFTDTNSMDPLFDEESNAIEIIPDLEKDIHIGDVVSYKSNLVDGIIIHRVISIEKDENGAYFILKGDNNKYSDPEKVRFEQIQRILVAIIY